MKTSLPLSDVVFTYTSQDGMPAMELTTADPRLAGKQLRVRIPRASPTYRSLLALLEAEALLPPDVGGYPHLRTGGECARVAGARGCA